MALYILRRLLIMIPTLFGVTVVSFCIMQLAPGDPLLAKAGKSGLSGQNSQTREAYLLQKRDLKLDKPLVLNFNYFYDFRGKVETAAYFMARSDQEIAADLESLIVKPPTDDKVGKGGDKSKEATPKASDEEEKKFELSIDPTWAARLKFLKSLKVPDLEDNLPYPKRHAALAQAIASYVQVFCEDIGSHGVPPAMDILDKSSDLHQKIGALRALNHMVVDPFVYTYSRHPTESETAAIVSTWKTWWDRNQSRFPAISPERSSAIGEQFAGLIAEKSRAKLLDGVRKFHQEDIRWLAEKLLGPSSLDEKVVAAMGLRQLAGSPLATDVSRDAKEKLVERVKENWQAWNAVHTHELHPGFLQKTWYIVADTQYAHMVWRLATFQFGRSAVKTREPVSEKIYAAMMVSAPLMFFAEVLIYVVAVPLGIFCAVRHNTWIDRLISLGLFLLYSIPAFVAGMLLLLVFCYGTHIYKDVSMPRLFPMIGLHSEGADHMGMFAWSVDYLHHAFLPVLCLSLFSLAAIAMYARGAMLDVISQDYVRTARAKGLSEFWVIWKHAIRNAMIPILTLLSNFLPAMLGGSILIEYIFGIHGMGLLNWESILLKDIPTVMAMIYIEALVVMLSILATDLLYVLADPRIGFQSQGHAG